MTLHLRDIEEFDQDEIAKAVLEQDGEPLVRPAEPPKPTWEHLISSFEDLKAVWPAASRQLEKSRDRWKGRFELTDLLNNVIRGSSLLWFIRPGPKGEGATAITTVIDYPRKRSLFIVLAEGGLADLKTLETEVADYAKKNSCAMIEFSGRRGWAKALGGYETSGVILTKEL